MASKLNEIRKILGLKPDCSLAEVVITPDMATELIKFNTKNRARHRGREKEYTADMREGKFCVSESMIGFNSEGELTNGQGRLYSCIESGTAFTSVVYLKLEQNLHMDTGRTRRTVDNIKLSEALVGVCNDSGDTIMSVKTLLRIARGTSRVRDEEVIEFCKKHAAIIDKAYGAGLLNLHGGKKAVFKSSIASAFLIAAINGVDFNDLLYIRNLLTDGMSINSRDKIILNFRDKAFELHGTETSSVRKQLYLGLQYTIYCYVNNKKTTKIVVDSEYYPL